VEKSKKKMNKIIVVLGPTATGKSDLAVKLAKKFNGEIISADSRQVYRGMDIGTGKITKKEMLGIPHNILDVVSPNTRFSVAQWQRQTRKIITDILSRGKLPIICGGTGFYIQSIVNNLVLPEVPPNKLLRKKLERKNVLELFEMLQKLDPERARVIDPKNPVRLIRAIEIATALGKVPISPRAALGEIGEFEFLQIGLNLPNEKLKERILARLLSRIKAGMLQEAKKLHENGVSWKRMFEFGLEYRYESLLLQNKITKQEFVEKLNTEIWHFAKRQMTWFKRDKNIKWFEPKQVREIERIVGKFLSNN
jgi:tRNA dimethylallyltransferase